MLLQILDWLQSHEDSHYADELGSLKLSPPTHIFELQDGLELEFGDETVQVFYPGPAHTPDNVVVYFPDRKLLFGGCMIIRWDQIGNRSDADLDSWPVSVKSLSQFDVNILVPGHGDRLDPALIEDTLQLLDAGK